MRRLDETAISALIHCSTYIRYYFLPRPQRPWLQIRTTAICWFKPTRSFSCMAKIPTCKQSSASLLLTLTNRGHPGKNEVSQRLGSRRCSSRDGLGATMGPERSLPHLRPQQCVQLPAVPDAGLGLRRESERLSHQV